MAPLSALSADSSRMGAMARGWRRVEETQMDYHEQFTVYGNSSGQDIVALYESDLSLRFSTYNEQGILPEPAAGNPSVQDLLEPESSAIETNAIADSKTPVGDIKAIILKQTLFLLLESLKHNRVVPQGAASDGAGKEVNRASNATSVHIEILEVYQSISVNYSIVEFEDFSAGATAQRIVNFALSFYSDGDRGEFAAMARAAIQEGFEMAAQFFGGWLPEVSYETYDLVMRALDEFVAGGKQEGVTTTVNIKA